MDREKELIARELMREREKEWTTTRLVRIFTGTWNVAGKAFEEENHMNGGISELLDFLHLERTGKEEEGGGRGGYDIVAIALQEIVALNTMNVVMDNSKSEEREVFWAESIQKCLDLSGEAYSLLCSNTLVGIGLFVFIKESLSMFAYDVRSCVAASGLLNVMGNKGGVAISFRLFDSNLCFVSAHLGRSFFTHSMCISIRLLLF